MIRLPLWPSSAHRWMRCPGQPRVTALSQRGPREESQYSSDGVKAHLYLNRRLKGESVEGIDLPPDQIEVVEGTVQWVKTFAEEHDLKIASEQALCLDFDTGNPVYPKHHMRLIIDIILYNDTDLIIVDYKHGDGVAVDVDNNPQLLLYLLAAAQALPGRKSYTVGIIQPRTDDQFSFTEVDPKTLIDFNADIKNAILKAYNPCGVEYVAGRHCQFCAGTKDPVCPAMLNSAIDALVEIKHGDDPDVHAWWLLDHIDNLRKIAKGVDTAADTWLKSGKEIEGWSLEERSGRSVWIEPEEVPIILANMLEGSEEDYYEIKRKPIGITAARKLAKQQGVSIDYMIKRPRILKRVKENPKNYFDEE